MKIRKLEYTHLCYRYETLKTLFHSKIRMLKCFENQHPMSFVQKAWLRMYIIQIKREMEEILFRIGRLRKYTPCDWCGSCFDKEI